MSSQDPDKAKVAMSSPDSEEARREQARAISARRHRVLPLNQEYSPDETEFLQAINAFRETEGRPFPSHAEIIKVLENIGYINNVTTYHTSISPLFALALNAYKRCSGRVFPMWAEVLAILKGMGYRKRDGGDDKRGFDPRGKGPTDSSRHLRQPLGVKQTLWESLEPEVRKILAEAFDVRGIDPDTELRHKSNISYDRLLVNDRKSQYETQYYGYDDIALIDDGILLTKRIEDPLSKQLNALIESVPADAPYEEQARQREALKHAFNQELATSHGEALKAEMVRRGADCKAYDDKLEIVRWANGELRRFGLALSTPKTGVGILTADRAVLEGRFVVKGKAKDKDNKTSYFYTKDVAELVENISVVDAPPRREGLAERIEREAETPPRNRRG